MKEELRLSSVLPRSLQSRFQSVGSYVTAVLQEAEEGVKKKDRLVRDEIELVRWIAFVHILDQLLIDGYEASVRATNAFKGLGMKGFMLGSISFEDENENVRLGKTLSERLHQSLERVKGASSFSGDLPLHQVVKEARKEILRARTMD